MTAISYSRLLMAGTLLGSALLWPLQSSAETGSQAAPPPEVAPMLTLGGSVLALETLDLLRGGTEVHIANDNMTNGSVYGNQATDLTTGSNLVSQGSFAGANGLATVIQNSGNNVLIQNSTIVNLQVQ